MTARRIKSADRTRVQALKRQSLRLAEIGILQHAPTFAIGLPIGTTLLFALFAGREGAQCSHNSKGRGLLKPGKPYASAYRELTLASFLKAGQRFGLHRWSCSRHRVLLPRPQPSS